MLLMPDTPSFISLIIAYDAMMLAILMPLSTITDSDAMLLIFSFIC